MRTCYKIYSYNSILMCNFSLSGEYCHFHIWLNHGKMKTSWRWKRRFKFQLQESEHKLFIFINTVTSRFPKTMYICLKKYFTKSIICYCLFEMTRIFDGMFRQYPTELPLRDFYFCRAIFICYVLHLFANWLKRNFYQVWRMCSFIRIQNFNAIRPCVLKLFYSK